MDKAEAGVQLLRFFFSFFLGGDISICIWGI